MKLKILKLGWEFPPNAWGGLGTACYGLIRGLTNNGIQVELVLPNDQKSCIKNCNIIHAKSGVSVPIIKNSKKSYYKKKVYANLYTDLFKRISNYEKSVVQAINGLDFDIIHAHDWMTFKAAIKLKKVSEKPLIVHIHSIIFDREKYNVNPSVYKIETSGMVAADKIVTVSNFTKQRIVKYYGINPDKITVVHNAISFGTQNSDKSHMGHSNSFALKKLDKIVALKKSFIVLFLGRLTAQKGPEYFIASARKILQKKNNVTFVVAGDGDMKDSLIAQAKKLKIKDKIIFTGFLRGKQIDRIYKIADVYVMPSACEPFGLAPLEAMRRGIPVVLAKEAGVCEIIKNCLKVDFEDVDQIAEQVISLLENPKLHKKLSQEGKKEAEGVSWDNAAQKCINLYQKFI